MAQCARNCAALGILPKTMKKKDPAAVALGSKGAKARFNTMTPEQRQQLARKAARARWNKQRGRT